MVTSTCACPDYGITVTCTVVGIGATVWMGSAFSCPSTSNEIILLHNRFNNGAHGICNNGDIRGTSLEAGNNSYTSKLEIKLTADILGSAIGCVYDNGISTTTIASINITGK